MELKVIKRAKDLTPGAFKIGTVVDLDTDDGYYTMGNSETVFEVVV